MARTEAAMTYFEKAQHLIALDDPIIYDVAAARGQKVTDVRELKWFTTAVSEYLQIDPTYYEDVISEMQQREVR
jgi:hypothetical protein